MALAPSRNVEPLHAARAVCRLLIPDEQLQFFTTQRISKDKKKEILPNIHPNLFNVIIGQIIRKSGQDFDKALSGLSRHIAKCGDRKKSRSAAVRSWLDVTLDGSQDQDTDIVSNSSESEYDDA